MTWFRCPHLRVDVELTDERESHVAGQHPDLLPQYRDRLATVLSDPDEVRRSGRLGNTWLFSHWFDDVRGGKHIVVVVALDPPPATRGWVVTAYIARRLSGGILEWTRS